MHTTTSRWSPLILFLACINVFGHTIHKDTPEHWAKQIAVSLFTWQPNLVKTHFLALKQHFTTQAWRTYQQSLEKSAFLTIIKQDNIEATAHLRKARKAVSTPIAMQRMAQGIMIVVPIRVIFENRQIQQTHDLNVQMRIIPSPQHHQPYRIAYLNTVALHQPYVVQKHPACPFRHH